HSDASIHILVRTVPPRNPGPVGSRGFFSHLLWGDDLAAPSLPGGNNRSATHAAALGGACGSSRLVRIHGRAHGPNAQTVGAEQIRPGEGAPRYPGIGHA